MNVIARATTPTIVFTFREVNVNSINVAYLTIRQLTNDVIERDITTAYKNATNNTISWTLTQEETLKLSQGKNVSVVCDWVTESGMRGVSQRGFYEVIPAGKNEVI